MKPFLTEIHRLHILRWSAAIMAVVVGLSFFILAESPTATWWHWASVEVALGAAVISGLYSWWRPEKYRPSALMFLAIINLATVLVMFFNSIYRIDTSWKLLNFTAGSIILIAIVIDELPALILTIVDFLVLLLASFTEAGIPEINQGLLLVSVLVLGIIVVANKLFAERRQDRSRMILLQHELDASYRRLERFALTGTIQNVKDSDPVCFELAVDGHPLPVRMAVELFDDSGLKAGGRCVICYYRLVVQPTSRHGNKLHIMALEIKRQVKIDENGTY